ncbi:hypothetical protein Tco_0408905 [Tanacetum coccineum]
MNDTSGPFSRFNQNISNYQYICKPATLTPKWELLEYGGRFRKSLTADSPLIRAELLPPHKRLGDPSSTYYHEVSVEVITKRDIVDSIETRVDGDIRRDTESDIDSNILADIEADIAAAAAATIEADAAAYTIVAVEADVEPVEAEVDAEPSDGDTVEIGVDVVAEPIVQDDWYETDIHENDKNEAKNDKTEHGNVKSVKSQSQKSTVKVNRKVKPKRNRRNA